MTTTTTVETCLMNEDVTREPVPKTRREGVNTTALHFKEEVTSVSVPEDSKSLTTTPRTV